MNKLIFLTSFMAVLLLGSGIQAQNNIEGSLGLPGDNLNLFAVMKVFQESKTLEDFERTLNAEESKINNLDLDGDNNIDYIRVIDNVDGNLHTIVLQVAINKYENQDVAVFTVYRDANNEVQIQLTGDEELYGKNYIIEPNFNSENASYQNETPNPGYTGNTQTIDGQSFVVIETTPVEIAAWPVITYIYTPTYQYWHSPWYYGYYPDYWRPWRPYYWHYYYGYHYNWNHYYYGRYRHWNHHRNSSWNDNYYYGRRSSSEVVHKRHQSGLYRDTYSKPEQRRDGAEAYNRAHPVKPGVSPGRPANNTNGIRPSTRPDINKPAQGSDNIQPTERPGRNKPVVVPERNRPVVNPGTNRPIVTPERNKPAVGNESNRPVVTPERNRPAARPENNRPVVVPERNKPAARPDINRPASRPENNKPVSQPNRPTVRPENNKPMVNPGKNKPTSSPAKPRGGKKDGKTAN